MGALTAAIAAVQERSGLSRSQISELLNIPEQCIWRALDGHPLDQGISSTIESRRGLIAAGCAGGFIRLDLYNAYADWRRRTKRQRAGLDSSRRSMAYKKKRPEFGLCKQCTEEALPGLCVARGTERSVKSIPLRMHMGFHWKLTPVWRKSSPVGVLSAGSRQVKSLLVVTANGWLS